MLNRRHIRVKLLHALYAFFTSENDDVARGERELFNSIDKAYELYIWMLRLLIEIKEAAWQQAEDRKKKRLPKPEDLNPNTKFIDNKFLALLQANKELLAKAEKLHVNWSDRADLVKKVWTEISYSEDYGNYMASPAGDLESDKSLIIKLLEGVIAHNDLLRDQMEEESIYFADDWVVTINAMVRTVDLFTEDSDANQHILQTFKDPESDTVFAKDLFRKTILNSKAAEALIMERVKNWEFDRLASIDVLLIKMGVTELLNFESIPIKVTINEYIELSKTYSTPQSKGFVNGILDKIVIDLKKENKIVKTGRGLIE